MPGLSSSNQTNIRQRVLSQTFYPLRDPKLSVSLSLSLSVCLSVCLSFSLLSPFAVLECFQEDSRCQSTMEFDDFSPLKHHHSMVHCAFLPATFYRIRRHRHPTLASHPLENTARTHTHTCTRQWACTTAFETRKNL